MMDTQDDLLTLTQWFSPAFPIGAYSYSHGLEWAIDAGEVAGAETLATWVADALSDGSGRNDALCLAAAHGATSALELAEIDALCRAFASSRERLMETTQQGAAFCKAVAAIWGGEIGELCYPVAVGAAARAQGLPLELTLALYLQAFASTLISVGIRLIPLGQTEGHRLIRALAPLCRDLAGQTRDGDLSDLGSTAFLADIAAMKHETQYSRIFRT